MKNLILYLTPALVSISLYAAIIPEEFVKIECKLTPMTRSVRRQTLETPEYNTVIATNNWSGYVAGLDLTTSVLNSVTAVHGTWIVPTLQPPTGNTPVAYQIYRDASLTQLVTTVPASGILQYDDHDRNPNVSYTYYIVSIDQTGSPSYPASTIVPAANSRVLQGPAGQSVDGPVNFYGTPQQNIFINAIDYYNHLTWSQPQLENTFCSIWVGIDGFNSPHVEQIGTEHEWISGNIKNIAWFEMYPATSINLDDFPLNAGDSISATVEYLGDDVFQMTITNNTQGIYFPIPTSLTTAPAPRSSVEWIVEAPTENGVLPLANFGTVFLTTCTAVINGTSGPINDPNWENTAVVMQSGGITKAIPSPLSSNGQDFNVTWLHD
jgi:hypothetical protein